ncbi:MAG: peptidase M48, partial [Ferruginibacter sp.]|nr:peptidase M48 [Cytophagales bacterium]
SGWVVQNSPQQLQMAPNNGKALLLLTLAAEKSLPAAAQQLVEKNQLTPVESKNTTVNGLPAIALVADPRQPEQDQQQPQQQQPPAIRALIYLIEYGGNVYSLMGITALKDFNEYLPTFRSTMGSFKTLTDPDKLNRKPDRIKIRTVKQGGTLAQALGAYQVKKDKLKELAILNGMELEDKVEPGTLIKVIEK